MPLSSCIKVKRTAIFLKAYGSAENAFETSTQQLPPLQKNEVLIAVEAFGLNYADVMARNGLYKAAPPLPAVLGYDVCGRITDTGDQLTRQLIGKRVMALTRFGGYATHAIAGTEAIIEIDDDISAADATALTTQYCTAFYCTHIATSINKEQIALQHAAAGGVGIAIKQMLDAHGVRAVGLAGNNAKVEALMQQGYEFALNYKTTDYATVLKEKYPQGFHHVFNSVAGKTVKKDLTLLKTTGTLVLYGAASRNQFASHFFGSLRFAWQTGLFTPLVLMMQSKKIAGVNMLAVGDNEPDILRYCLEKVWKLYKAGVLKPESTTFDMNQIAEAHQWLDSGQSTGKIAVKIN